MHRRRVGAHLSTLPERLAAFSASTCSFLVPLGWAWLQGQFPRSAPVLVSSRPGGFRSPAQIAGFAFCKSTNNLLLTLRKTAFACLESGTLRSGSPQPIGAEKEHK